MTFILGCGNVGSLVANALLKVSKSELILIFQNQAKLDKFVKNGSAITIHQPKIRQFDTVTYSQVVTPKQLGALSPENSLYSLFSTPQGRAKVQTGISSFLDTATINSANASAISTNLNSKSRRFADGDDDDSSVYIDNLIITTKAQHTLDALIPILHLINEKTNLIFIQNGAGVVETVMERYFLRMAKESSNGTKLIPNVYQGIISHGVYLADRSKFEFKHTSLNGELKLGRVVYPKDRQDVSEAGQASDGDAKLPEIISELLDTSLNVSYYHNNLEFRLIYLEKLIVNAVVNPLTTIFECQNGELFQMTKIRKMIYRLLREDIRILRENYFAGQELKESERQLVNSYLNEEKLLNVILRVLSLTQHNYSSMLQDFKANRQTTEIYYLNGYFIKLGKGNAPANKIVLEMVQGKLDLQKYRSGLLHL